MKASVAYRILHAGLHKTGSTFLQKYVFPNIEGVCFVPHLNMGKLPFVQSRNSILFSNEGSCGYPYPICEEFNVERIMNSVSILKVDRVIIFKREFFSWILSLYFQTLNEGCTWSLAEFVGVNKDNLISWRDAQERVVQACQHENVKVLVVDYEILLTEGDAAIQAVVDFVGGGQWRVESSIPSRSNPSRYGTWSISWYRRLNEIANFRLGRIVFSRLICRTPRKLIAGRLGALLDKLSPRSLTPSDVETLLR